MQEMQGGVAVLKSASQCLRSNDVEFKFRQDSDFFYLTGFEEPEAICVLTPSSTKHRFLLFVQPRDKNQEQWSGKRSGMEGAQRVFGADKAYPVSEFNAQVPALLSNQEKLYYAFGKDEWFDRKILSVVSSLRSQVRAGLLFPAHIIDPSLILREMRLLKSPEEIVLHTQAARIAAQAHCEAMKAAKPGMYEHDIEALLEFTFRKEGAAGPAYPSIVASGSNACVLHYSRNNRKIKKGDLLLIDAGCEFQMYNSDITRTFPVGIPFSKEQKAVYEIVLQSQKEAVKMVRPGKTIMDVHNRAVEVITEGLVRLKLLTGNVKKIVKDGSYRRFFMHKTSHWLGMDVHDAGSYRANKQWRKLQPGIVLTVEPGVYIAPSEKHVPSGYRGIGVRIEDDVLVTKSGNDILTKAAPKEVNDVLSLCSI